LTYTTLDKLLVVFLHNYYMLA